MIVEKTENLVKLPDWLVSRWSRIGVDYKDRNKEFPSCKVFADCVGREAKIASDPVTSVQSVRSSSQEFDVLNQVKTAREHKNILGVNRVRHVGGRSCMSNSQENTNMRSDSMRGCFSGKICFLCKKNPMTW